MLKTITRRLAAALPLALLSASLAFGQVQPGQSPLSVPKGGSGNASFGSHCILYGNGSGPLACLSAVNNGVLVFSGSGVPNASTTLPSALTVPAPVISGHPTIEGVTSTGATGTDDIVFGTSPSLTTPTIGVASATSVNKVAITAPASGATLTISDGVTLTGPAASGTAMTLGNAETVTGAKSFNSGKVILNGSSSGSTTVNAAAAASGTLTLPAATDTLVGKATTDTLTNKTFDTAGTGNSFSINGVAATANTGSGSVVRATSPTMVTPTLGVASATSINKMAITAPATGSTLAVADGKTATISNTLTFTGTDGSSVAFGAGGTVAYRSDNLGVFAATTSLQLAGILSDETGSGAAVFGTSPTISAPTITGHATIEGVTATGATGTGNFVFGTSPSLTTPTIGVASATSVNKVAITAPASGATLTIPDGVTLTGPAASGTAMTLGNAETVTGAKSFNSGKVILNGSSSGSTTVNAAAAASGTLTLPAATDTLVGKATTDTLTNKTFDTAGTGNSFSINGVAATANTGSGSVVRATSPTMVTPTLGVASATSINKMAITAPATGSTLAVADGKTATISNTLTFTGTDGSSVAFGAGGTVAYRSDNLGVFAATTSLQLAGILSDETGSGAAVFGTSPTISAPTITGHATIEGVTATGATGTGNFVFGTSPSLTTPTIGVASATSVNKVAITAPASGATLTIPDGVTLTGPAASGTAMTLGNAETVTGAKSFNSGKVILNGSSSGSTTVNAAAAASGTLTLPAATDTLVGKATTDTLTNKTFDTASNTFDLNGATFTTATNATAALNAMVGDSGSGGTKGLVPAPGAGDGAADKYLDATGAWSVPAGGGGGGGMTDTERQDFLLNYIYQAKLFGTYRRATKMFADGFMDAAGIATLTNGARTSTNAQSSFVAPSVTLTRVTGATPTTPLGGTAANINDNNTGTNISLTTIGDLSSAGINSRIMAKLDLGSVLTVTEIEVKQLARPAGGATSNGLQYSTDGTTWTQLGTTIAVPSTVTDFTRTGSVSARYVAFVLDQTNYGSSAVQLSDLNAYTSPVSNMTIVTTAQTASASSSNGRVLIEYDNTATPTLNTDLTAEVSCDGGTTWTSASLSSAGTGQGGRSVAETVDQAVTAGTSIQARIKTLNNKSIPIYGVTIQWH